MILILMKFVDPVSNDVGSDLTVEHDKCMRYIMIIHNCISLREVRH